MAKKKTNIQEYRCATIPDLHRAFNEIKSSTADDTVFMCRALLFIAESLAPAPKPKVHKLSEWQKFFAKEMKAGKSPAEIGAAWKAKKAI